jgi:hypothetical protein
LVIGHGGELTLRSTPGEGTVAEIRLPAERVIEAGPAGVRVVSVPDATNR